jgi:hypothetical protein
VRSEGGTKAYASAVVARRAERFVVCRGVRHVPIDLLPWDVVTFRAVCGQDVVEDERPCAEPTDCKWCRRYERTWLLVKATSVI